MAVEHWFHILFHSVLVAIVVIFIIIIIMLIIMVFIADSGPYHRRNHATQEHKKWLAIL